MIQTQENLKPQNQKDQIRNLNNQVLYEQLAQASKTYRENKRFFADKLTDLKIAQENLPIFNYFYSLQRHGGHDRKFAIKKAQNFALKEVIETQDGLLSKPQKDLWGMCASFLEFAAEAQQVIEAVERCDKEKITGLLEEGPFKKLLKGMKKNLVNSWFCHIRGCPVCDWEKA